MKKEVCLLFGIIAGCQLNAQTISPSIINSTGGTAKAGAYTVDWSFCEVTLASTFSTPNLIVTQGVLQSDPLANSNGINDITSVQKTIRVFPNPSSDVIYLQAEDKSVTGFTYSLLDISGKIVLISSGNSSLTEKDQRVDLTGLPAGTYILEITESQKRQNTIQTYKVQKIN
jgi:Secretion system C-terminal sorting domain